jgi:hypothetical protein
MKTPTTNGVKKMKKFSIQTRLIDCSSIRYVILDVRGNQVGIREFSEEWEARLAAVHWACAPSLPKRLNLKKVDGIFSGRPFSGVKVASMYKQRSGEWRAIVDVDGERVTYIANTQKAVCLLIDAHGDDEKITRNILNPDSHEIKIARRDWGGCCDPGTERYHSM